MLGKIRTKVWRNQHKSSAEIFSSFLRGEFQEKNIYKYKFLDSILVFQMIFSGAAVTAKTTCNSGHEEVWNSSHNVGRGRESTPYINVLLITYAFMTGLHFDQLKVRLILLSFLLFHFSYLNIHCLQIFVKSGIL